MDSKWVLCLWYRCYSLESRTVHTARRWLPFTAYRVMYFTARETNKRKLWGNVLSFLIIFSLPKGQDGCHLSPLLLEQLHFSHQASRLFVWSKRPTMLSLKETILKKHGHIIIITWNRWTSHFICGKGPLLKSVMDTSSHYKTKTLWFMHCNAANWGCQQRLRLNIWGEAAPGCEIEQKTKIISQRQDQINWDDGEDVSRICLMCFCSRMPNVEQRTELDKCKCKDFSCILNIQTFQHYFIFWMSLNPLVVNKKQKTLNSLLV